MTVLARLDGQDTTAENGDWFGKGMAWAKVQAISDGTAPEGNITREQLAVMLYRYAGTPKTGDVALSEFGDASNVSDYAERAMRWAVECGIIKGVSGNLNPGATATRAEVAAMLQRFIAQ